MSDEADLYDDDFEDGGLSEESGDEAPPSEGSDAEAASDEAASVSSDDETNSRQRAPSVAASRAAAAAPARKRRPDPILASGEVARLEKVAERMTHNVLSRTELALILAMRAAQIEDSNIAFVEAGNLDSSIEIAKKELAARRCPLLLHRRVGPHKVEEWDPNLMAIPTI